MGWFTDNIGGILSAGLGLFGQKEASDAAGDAAQAQVTAAAIAAEAGKFKPYGVTTGFGSSYFDPESGTAGYDLDPALAAYRDSLMQGSAASMPTDFDPTANADKYYSEMQAMMAPQRAQQAANMQQNMFGSGRLGMRLAGEAAGAGAGGMYQPDIFGMNRANALADQQLAMQARTQSMAELDSAIARSQGMFTGAMGVEEMGLRPLEIGAALGGRQASAGANAGQALLTGATNAANANMAAGVGWGNTLADLGAKLGTFQWSK